MMSLRKHAKRVKSCGQRWAKSRRGSAASKRRPSYPMIESSSCCDENRELMPHSPRSVKDELRDCSFSDERIKHQNISISEFNHDEGMKVIARINWQQRDEDDWVMPGLNQIFQLVESESVLRAILQSQLAWRIDPLQGVGTEECSNANYAQFAFGYINTKGEQDHSQTCRHAREAGFLFMEGGLQ